MFSLSVFLWRRAAPDAFPPFLPLSLASLLVLTGLRFFSFGIITTPHNIVSTAAPTHLLYAVYLPTMTIKRAALSDDSLLRAACRNSGFNKQLLTLFFRSPGWSREAVLSRHALSAVPMAAGWVSALALGV